LAVWIYRAIGAGLAIAVMELLALIGHQPLARLPFVTSIVLTMSTPDSEPAQPYPIIAGHLLSSAAGFAVLWTLGPGEVSTPVAVGLAALLMLGCRAMHRRLPCRRARPADELDRQPGSDRRATAGGVFAGLDAGRTPFVALGLAAHGYGFRVGGRAA
jgi:hypothetical protein